MRIALIATLYPPYILGGAEYSTRLLVSMWRSMGHEVLVLTTSDHDEQEIMDDVRIVRLKNKNIYWRYPQREKPMVAKAVWHAIDTCNPFYNRQIQEAFRDFQPDVVSTGNLCGISVSVWKICHRMHIPVVHTLRDYYLLCPVQTMSKHGKACATQCTTCKVYSFLKKRMSRYVDAVVGISQDILGRHLEYGYFANAKQQVIPNSVPRQISTDTKQLPPSRVIGYIGRLSPEKGVELLIQAFSATKMQKQYVLRIAGEGNSDYKQALVDKYASPYIQFVGQQPSDVFLTEVELIVVPSLWNEPFGRVVIEAYAAHRPVLLANNGGLSELQKEGISWAFSTDSPEELTSLLDRYAKGDLVIRNENFDDALREFDATSVAKKYIQIFNEVIGHE